MPRPFAVVLIAGLSAAGCSRTSPTDVTPATVVGRGGDHGHERERTLIADLGPYHAALTARLSAAGGNELDLFVESAGKEQKPVALPVESFTATARRAGDEKEHTLAFEPAPADERPQGEKPGTCSHFVAKAGWLRPDDVLTITATLPVNGKPRRAEWADFVPRKYARHED